MRLIAWDLETSNLNADYGMILCAGFKVIGKGKPVVMDAEELGGEKNLLKAISAVLLSADAWVTWYGTFFDIPFLNTRLLYHKLPIVPPNYAHIDGWKVARNRLKLRNNRLATVQDFLGLPTEKDAVNGPTWIKAMRGDRKALNYIVNHCRKDVLVLEQAYNRLKPLIIDHPYSGLGGRGKCSLCGSKRIQYRGRRLTRTRAFRRFQCQKCGHWDSEKTPIKVAE